MRHSRPQGGSDNLQRYRHQIEEISRSAGSRAWTPGLAAAFYLLLLVLAITIIASLFVTIGNVGITVLLLALEVGAALVPVFIYYSRGGKDVSDRCMELDRTKPGLYEAYLEWKDEQREKMPDSYIN